MTTKAKDIGERIAAARHRLGMSQAELAERANLTQAYVSMLESGKNFPSISTLGRIAGALDTRAAHLIDGEAA